MGCCFSSTPYSKQPQNAPKHQQPNLGSHEKTSRIRIQQPLEEEYVKEVLSETPISKPQQQVPILMPKTKTQLPLIQHPKLPIKKSPESEEVSAVSETCSNGESFSTTTTATTVTENREDEATSKRSNNGTRHRKRSYAVDGNRTGAKEGRPISPARKPEILAVSRPILLREPDHPRRYPVERTERRKMSTSWGGRSQLRPPGGSGRRVPPAKGVMEENDSVSVQESLENPHVSLECFIFL